MLRFLDDPCVDNQFYLHDVTNYYHQRLLQSQQGLEYLAKRGLDSKVLIESCKLGLADRTLGHLLPSKQNKRGRAIRTKLCELGILRPSGRERLCGSLVVPYFDASGSITQLYGRKTTSRLRKGTPLHVYCSDKARGVWNLSGFKVSSSILLANSPLDALTLWVHGYTNVSCLNHTRLASDSLLAAIRNYGIKEVTLAFEPDAELVDQLVSLPLTIYQLALPLRQDINDVVTTVEKPDEVLSKLMKAARILGNGKVQAASGSASQAQANDSEGRSDEDSESSTGKSVVEEDQVTLKRGDRVYRARGVAKNTDYTSMRVNLLVTLDGEFHQDSINLYSAKHRAAFTKLAALELGIEERVVHEDLGKLLMLLEEVLDQRIQASDKAKSTTVELSDSEREEALELLRSPRLCQRIVEDYHSSGFVGEETNLLVAYLAATSRKLDNPLAVVVQSTSAAGKSTLMDAALDFIPPEDIVRYSAITGQSLFYFSDGALRHKVLALAESIGAEKASYALKVLQSDGELRIASTGKESSTGRMTTQEYLVQGPIALFETTTEIDLDEELLNRCLVLSVSEGRDQTTAIHEVQRRSQTLEGILAKREKDRIVKLHRNAQRFLRPVIVSNPYAPQLTFLDSRTRTRRDHAKYLTLIRSIALLHQYQREVRSVEHRGELVEYIEATPADIEVANTLAHRILGQSLDELPPQTRNLLNILTELVTKACDTKGITQEAYRFTRKQVWEYAGWSYQQVRIHLQRLIELEYVLVHRSGRGSQHLYELLYDGTGTDGQPFVMGLLDSRRLKATPSVSPKEG